VICLRFELDQVFDKFISPSALTRSKKWCHDATCKNVPNKGHENSDGLYMIRACSRKQQYQAPARLPQ
jgi:hypothetical protein